jgi:radical SAM superfamily enzyme YgiQ (UPF0313 family)
MKILLIEPPFARFMGFYRFFFPFALSSLSAYLKQEGHEVLIYDADHAGQPVDMNSTDLLNVFSHYLEGIRDEGHPTWLEAEEVMREFSPDLIGITYLSTKKGAVELLTRLAKRLFPDVPVVLGGSHPSFLPESSLEQTGADFVVVGEGEETFTELLRYLDRGDDRYSEIRGLAYRDPSGTYVATPARPLIADLDSLPFPDRESLHRIDSYRPDDMSMIMTSRGCPFDCTFCSSLWERRARFRSIDNILAEIVYLRERFGIENVYFKDDTFTVNRKWILAFCDALKQKDLGVKWECLTRIELVDEELILRMREAGMFNLKIGIETGSERLLKATHKNITLAQIREGAAVLRRLGQRWSAFFMLGYPDETEEEMRQSRELIEEIRPTYVSMSVLVPYPGCETYFQLERDGVLTAEADWNLYDPFSLYAHASRVFPLEEFQRKVRETMAFVDRYNLHSEALSSKISATKQV